MGLACQKPTDFGYSYEVWTERLLASHIHREALSQGHPSLVKLSPGTVSKILAAQDLQPHKVWYYCERRDPDFEPKMVQVRHVYRPPTPGEHPTWNRDYEYVRHGTVTLLAGLDLATGEVIGLVRDRHRSHEFIEFLRALDNHSAHTSKETRAYLATVPNRFEFVFAPFHGLWLNLVETFFAKMTHPVLRHIQVASKEELVRRLEQYLCEVNEQPGRFRWTHFAP